MLSRESCSIAAERVPAGDRLCSSVSGRVRDVVCGPDGAIYVVLNSPGIILRLTPKMD